MCARNSESTIATRATAAAAPSRRRPLEGLRGDPGGFGSKCSGPQALEYARADRAESPHAHRTLGPTENQHSARAQAALDFGPELGEGLRTKVHRRVAEENDVPDSRLDSFQDVRDAPANLVLDSRGERPSLFLSIKVTVEERVRHLPYPRLVVDRSSGVFDRLAPAVGAQKTALRQPASLSEENRQRVQLGAFGAAGAPRIESGMGPLAHRKHFVGQPLKYVEVAKERGHAHQHHVYRPGDERGILLQDSLGLGKARHPQESQAGWVSPSQGLPPIGPGVQSSLGQEPIQKRTCAVGERRFLRGLAYRDRWRRDVHRLALPPGGGKDDLAKTVGRKHAGPPGNQALQPLSRRIVPRSPTV